MNTHLILLTAVLAVATSSPAAPVYWFGTADSSAVGGAGTWDTIANHFSTSPSGPADTPWDNITNPGDPVFEGTPGTVTISSITNNGTLTVNADYTFSSSTLTFGPSSAINVAAGQTLTTSCVLAGGPLTKDGDGTLVLGAANTYTNNTYLNAGTIAFGAGGSATLGVNAAGNRLVIGANGATIAQRSNTSRSPQVGVDQLGDITFDTGIQNANVAFTLVQGNWQVNGHRKITSTVDTGTGLFIIGNTPTTTGRIVEHSGAASLTKDGPGTLTIQAENDLTGGFTIMDGTVRAHINANNPFGSGTLTLSGGRLATTGNRTSALANSVDVLADCTITTSAAAAAIAFPFSGVFGAVGGTTLTFTGNTTAGQAFNPSWSAGFNYAGKIAINNNGGPTTLQLLNEPGSDLTFADVISGSGGISRSSAFAGTGGVAYMNAANTYSGGTALIDGAVGLGISSTPGPNQGGPPLNDGPIGTGTLTVSPVFGAMPMLFTSGGDCEIGNSINLASAAAPLVVSNADILMFYGPITGSGSITKAGAGQLRLSPRSASSDYTGGTILSEGEIAFDASSSEGTRWGPIGQGTLYIGQGTGLSALSNPRTVNNALVFSGTSAAVNGNRDLTLAGSAHLSFNTVTLTVNNSALTTLSGELSNGGLVKDGPGTLVLTHANTYGLGTAVGAGTLDVQADGGLGSGSVSVASGATLRLSGGSANTYIDSSATLTLDGASPLVNLDFTGTPNTINALYFGAAQQASGTWGAVGSGASHESAFFSGTGTLLVSTGGGVIYSETNNIVSVENNGGDTFTLTFQGTPGAEYYLISSPDVTAALSAWTPVDGSTNVAPSPSGLWTFPVNAPAPQFYRLKATNPAP